MAQATSTTTVPWITWFWVGHSTFLSSAQHSPMKPKREPTPALLAGGADVLGRDAPRHQASRAMASGSPDAPCAFRTSGSTS